MLKLLLSLFCHSIIINIKCFVKLAGFSHLFVEYRLYYDKGGSILATKYITFNYFEPVLVRPEQAFESELSEGNEEQPFIGDIWNMAPFMNFLSINTIKDDNKFAYQLGGEYADVEPKSFIKKNDLSHIQVSKLRETNIPAKKKIGEIKQEILLQHDEYIGEFNSMLYDHELHVLMIQSNLYGLSTKHLENYLTELRFRFLEYEGYSTEMPLMVKLNPIIDPKQIDDAMSADYYRKIRIRGADLRVDALNEDKEDLINEVARTVNLTQGVNVDLQISVGRAERTRSLDNDTIRNTLETFNQLPENKKPNIELTLIENEDAQIETINLIRPRFHDRISFNVEPRTTIEHTDICKKMMNSYKERRNRLRSIIDRS